MNRVARVWVWAYACVGGRLAAVGVRGLGIWGWTGLLGSFSCDRPLALIPSTLKVNSLHSHFTLEGNWKRGGRKKKMGREERGRGGEKILWDSEVEDAMGWRREGQEGSQMTGKWEKAVWGAKERKNETTRRKKNYQKQTIYLYESIMTSLFFYFALIFIILYT